MWELESANLLLVNFEHLVEFRCSLLEMVVVSSNAEMSLALTIIRHSTQ